MNTTKLLKSFNFPEAKADPALTEGMVRQLQHLLDDYEISDIPSLQSVQILLVYNYDCARVFEHKSGLFEHKIKSINCGDKTQLWFLDGRKNGTAQSTGHLVFYAMLQLLLKEFAGCANDVLKSLDIVLLYNLDYEKLNLEQHLEKSRNRGGTEHLNFQPLEPKFRLERVVLNRGLREEIMNVLLVLSKRKLIYDDWGFGEVEPAPKAILNFYGPSGTGKTMTAHAIASHLDLKILTLNYADIESKFVGDAPKNLVKAFEVAQKENALLFFDEADSFLGKRIANVSSSSDQAVNSLRSQMLILLENFTGLVIFATNLLSNYDKAFESRIFKHLHFNLPDEANRKEIIKVTIPSRMPFEKASFDDADIDRLVALSDNFSGRHIKNAVLNSLTNAVAQERLFVTFDDFKKGFQSIQENLANFDAAVSAGSGKKISAELKKIVEEKVNDDLANNRVGYAVGEPVV